MLYREMPKNGNRISILGFGCMRLPGGQMRPSERRSVSQIRWAIDQGVNYLDTAWPYHGGKSEVILGRALKGGYRKKVRIADKLPHWLCNCREDMDYYLEAQLERLDVVEIDYYLLHSLEGVTWRKARDLGVIDFMEQAKKNGLIRNAGFSFHGPREDFKEIIDDYDWDFSQIQFNIIDEHDQAGIEGLEYAASKNVGVIVMEPLRGGVLGSKLPPEVQNVYDSAPVKRTNAEWALRWVWDHPGVVCILSGMNDEKHIAENIRIASEAEPGSLTQEELAITRKAGDTFRGLMKVPCTGCQYCMPCPKGVNIPASFTHYNNKYLFKQGLVSKMMYLILSSGLQGREPSLASQCVNCGLCMEHCPQKINIPDELTRVQKEFEGPLSGMLVYLANKALSLGSLRAKNRDNPRTCHTCNK